MEKTAPSEDPIRIGPGDALLIVDMQNDFLPGGRLAVTEGNRVISPLNRCLALFRQKGLPVFATRDWHPPDHCSFQPQGGPWPVHCVAGTPGAAFAPGLELPPEAHIVSKATRPDRDAYSGFQDTSLAEQLHRAGVERLFVGGLATDYCVLNTVRDALQAGFSVVLLTDAIRAVDLHPGDGERAVAEMASLGARLARSDQLAP